MKPGDVNDMAGGHAGTRFLCSSVYSRERQADLLFQGASLHDRRVAVVCCTYHILPLGSNLHG